MPTHHVQSENDWLIRSWSFVIEANRRNKQWISMWRLMRSLIVCVCFAVCHSKTHVSPSSSSSSSSSSAYSDTFLIFFPSFIRSLFGCTRSRKMRACRNVRICTRRENSVWIFIQVCGSTYVRLPLTTTKWTTSVSCVFNSCRCACDGETYRSRFLFDVRQAVSVRSAASLPILYLSLSLF